MPLKDLEDDGRITPAQLLGARGMLGWSREELCEKAGTPVVTIKGFEALGAESKPETIAKWRKAIAAAGVIFLEPDGNGGPGVRFKKGKG